METRPNSDNMEDTIKELAKEIKESLSKKSIEHKNSVINSQAYQQELKYLEDITSDFIISLRAISFYSARAGNLYDDFLTIRAIDDILQSSIGIMSLVENGIHNSAKRELRYLIELVTKFVIIDYEKMGEKYEVKTQFLKDHIPNSSIDIIADRYTPPFKEDIAKQFKSEVKDYFGKACAYVHPSKKQIDEQIKNYENGNTIGFESAKMFRDVNTLIFRAYDMILVMMFHGFGHSMSADLFTHIFDENLKWKFHKGKYIKEYKKNFDYKLEKIATH